MDVRALVRSSLFSVDPEPYSGLPERLALFYACKAPLYTLMLLNYYVKEYSAYWFEALKSDLEEEVERKEEEAREEMETLIRAVKYASREIESEPVLGSIEVLDLMSLLNIDAIVHGKALKKASLEASLGLHVEKLHKKGLKEAIPCLMSVLKVSSR